ncbi:MAG: prepilin-type N-terminal cleavage/methylation domain-containing protein [Myxococcota bacterium]|nr:prepilin-type N-terminal cleavage/methylation domain-containing protein [Myxococcota bacterium]
MSRGLGRSAAQAGFTVVELLMAVVVLATAAAGIFAFERAIVQSNSRSNDLTAATAIADFWMERARTEATLWRHSPVAELGDALQTPLLAPLAQPAFLLVAGNATGWLDIPNLDPAIPGSPRLNRHLEPWTAASPPTTDVGEFCSQYRLTTLAPGPTALVRIEVRVLWYKVGATRSADWAVCPSAGMFAPTGNPDLETVHTLQVASTLWSNAR